MSGRKLRQGVNSYIDGLIEAGTKLTRKIANHLDDLEASLAGKIYRTGNTRPATIVNLLSKARGLITNAFNTIAGEHHDGLVGVVIGTSKTFSMQLPEEIVADVVTQAVAEDIARDTLIAGAKSGEWWLQQEATLIKRFTTQMRLGLLAGEDIEDLVKRLRGTRAMGFKDGLMALSHAQAEALVRTSVVNVANGARLATYVNDQDLISAVEWVITRDDRTTEICEELDGKQWSLPESGDALDFRGYKPIRHATPFPGFTAHWNCRSTQLPVLKEYAELAT